MDQNLMIENKLSDNLNHNDAGIWICECSGISISPCLLMQALCSESYPQPATATWNKDGLPPKPFQKTRTIPLLYGKCSRPLQKPGSLHLFSIQSPVAPAFEQSSQLQEWQFPINIRAIIVLFDQRHNRPGAETFFEQVLGKITPTASVNNHTLAWVKAQQLPFVVAAANENATPQDETRFRQRYQLPANIPIISGPALSDERLKANNAGLFQFLFSGQRVSFAREYAQHILEILNPLIEEKSD